jgi:hypothetical protein
MTPYNARVRDECLTMFTDDTAADDRRLVALKCAGLALSTMSSDIIMQVSSLAVYYVWTMTLITAHARCVHVYMTVLS